MKNKSLMVLLLGSFVLTGCGGSKDVTSPESAPPDSVVPSASTGSKSIDLASVGSLHGKVSFEGTAPEPKSISVKGNPECAALHPGGMIASEELIVKDGNLQNVLVYVKQGLEGYSFSAPAAPVTIENKTCMYTPHVSAAMKGQEVIFLNQDSTLHNIHSYSKNSKAFNLGLPLVGMKQSRRFDVPEVAVQLKCDVHPWMLGYLAILSNPYFQVTGPDGSFELKNLPPGDYVIEAWHEKLGAQTQNVTIASGDSKELQFKFSAAS